MNTEHPTTTLYFVFAFTFCHVEVYKDEEAFMRKVLRYLNEKKVVEFSDHDNGENPGQKTDTRLLIHLFSKSAELISGEFSSARKLISSEVLALLTFDDR